MAGIVRGGTQILAETINMHSKARTGEQGREIDDQAIVYKDRLWNSCRRYQGKLQLAEELNIE